MLFEEIIAVFLSSIQNVQNTPCGLNVGTSDVKTGGKYNNHWALKRYVAYRNTVSVIPKALKH
jgi:hypothetical protein